MTHRTMSKCFTKASDKHCGENDVQWYFLHCHFYNLDKFAITK